jgi:hypothetical protein
MNKILVLISAAIAAGIGIAPAASTTEPASATVPMVLDHNRMTVEVEFMGTDGAAHKTRAWVDSGGMTVSMVEPLARELGINLSAMPAGGGRSFDPKSAVPVMRVGGIALDTEGMNVMVDPSRMARPGVQAECVLPARCLRRLHVVFDYPARRLTLAKPGVLTPQGTAVPCRVNPETGLFMVETTIEGQKAALGVDTGSAGTWVSDRLTSAWLTRHPDWPRAVGAAGSTNFFGFALETKGALLQLPSLTIGSIPVQAIAVLGLDQGLFDWYSNKSAAAVDGFLGADVIARFRLEVDFPGQKSWWEPGPVRTVRDLDIVGLTVGAERDGSFIIAGTVMRNGQSVAPGVQAGDKLLAVDSLEATNAPMGSVIDALRGKPGAVHTLRLEREGKTITVQVPVVHLP